MGLIIAAGVLNLVDRQIIAVLKPEIAGELHWSDDDYGTLAAWLQVGAAAGSLVSGWIVDWIGVRWANAAGVAAWSLAAMTHSVVHSFGQFVAVRTTLGATEAIGAPAGIKTIAAILPPRWRSTGFGIANAAYSLGAILAPLAIPAAALLLGWRNTFVVAGVAGLCWSLLWLRAFDGVDMPSEAVAAAPAYGPVFANRRTWAIIGAKLLSDATWWLLLFWLPDFFHRRFGISGVALGPPLALAYGGAAMGSLVGGLIPTGLLARGYALDRVRKGAMLVAALLVLPLPLTLATGSYAIAVALMALALAGHQIFSTNLFALISDVVPAAKVGRVTAVGTFSGNVGGVAIAKITGMLLAAGFGYAPLLYFAVVSYPAALAWIGLLLPRIVPVDDTADGS